MEKGHGKAKNLFVGIQVAMVHLLEKGTHNMSQVSRNYHVTRSLLYTWMRLYQERGGTAFVPGRATQSPPEVERPQNEQERLAYLERLCGQQAFELELLRSEVDLLKKTWHQLPFNSDTL